MKKGLLGSTALVAATALSVGAAQAQGTDRPQQGSAPTWKLSGNMNFQAYVVDQDFPPAVGTVSIQDGGIYFGVDEAEIQINADGTTDAGLDYGFKIELNANTSDARDPTGTNSHGGIADEARIQLGGSWGVVQLGDEDGAEDIMNYGGETIMGATGGFDGDQDDWYLNTGAATSFPTIAGDTSDATKASYFSPRFSGFQLGGSWTPSPDNDGDFFKIDGEFENHIGLGANYDQTFNNFRLRLSAVYSMASQSKAAETLLGAEEDIGAYSVGGILGFGGFSVAANWTDNADSGETAGSGLESSYWNTSAAWEGGPWYLSLGYMSSVAETAANVEDEYTHLAATIDYTVAPGFVTYLEYSAISSKDTSANVTNDGTGFILGTNISF